MACCLIHTASKFFVVTFRGCRQGFEPLPTRKANMHIQEAMGKKGRDATTISTGIRYDPQLANGGGGGATSGSESIIERETVGKNGGNGSNAQARPDQRRLLAPRPLKSFRRAQELERREMRRVQEAGGGQSREEKRRIPFSRECLLPFKLLEGQRVLTVLFVRALFAMRIGFLPSVIHGILHRCVVQSKVVLLRLMILSEFTPCEENMPGYQFWPAPRFHVCLSSSSGRAFHLQLRDVRKS